MNSVTYNGIFISLLLINIIVFVNKRYYFCWNSRSFDRFCCLKIYVNSNPFL